MKLGEKLVQVGGVLTGLGGAVAVAFWIFTLESDGLRSFWTFPGIVGLIVAALGLVLMVCGLVPGTEASGIHQEQRSGDSSKNYQSGRDMKIGRDQDEA